MKKIKMMLLSFALLAVVGGALAFKAKFNQQMCYRITTGAGANPICPLRLTTSTTTTVQADAKNIYYTTTPQDLQGFGLTCYTWVDVEGGATTTLTCTSTFVKAD